MSASAIYNVFKTQLMKKAIDMVNDTVNCALMTNSHATTVTNTQWSDVSANEITGTGYVAGGAALANKSVTQDNVGNRGVFTADAITWTSASFTAYNAVLYDNTTATKYLVVTIDLGGAQTVSSGDFKIQWSANGILACT